MLHKHAREVLVTPCLVAGLKLIPNRTTSRQLQNLVAARRTEVHDYADERQEVEVERLVHKSRELAAGIKNFLLERPIAPLDLGVDVDRRELFVRLELLKSGVGYG